VPYVLRAPDQASDDEAPIPCLLVTSPPRPSVHAAAPSPANSDDKVLIPHFSHRSALVLCDGDAEVSLPRPGVSCLSSSNSPPIVHPQRAPQAGGRGRFLLRYGYYRFASSSSSLSVSWAAASIPPALLQSYGAMRDPLRFGVLLCALHSSLPYCSGFLLW
jgi:hypothetical protein